jgi:hypothetical protein
MPMLREKLSLSAVGAGLPPAAWMSAAGLDAMTAAGAGAVAAAAGVIWGRTVEMLTGGTVVVTGAAVGRVPMAGAVVSRMMGSGDCWAAGVVAGRAGGSVVGLAAGARLGEWLGLVVGVMMVTDWPAEGAAVIGGLVVAVAVRVTVPAVVSSGTVIWAWSW